MSVFLNQILDPLGRLEFTHHIYEEYQPVYPKESKPPIILHSVPHYSVANYFTLNKHLQHYPNYDQVRCPLWFYSSLF